MARKRFLTELGRMSTRPQGAGSTLPPLTVLVAIASSTFPGARVQVMKCSSVLGSSLEPLRNRMEIAAARRARTQARLSRHRGGAIARGKVADGCHGGLGVDPPKSRLPP